MGVLLVSLTDPVLKIRVANIYVLSVVLRYSQCQHITVTAKVSDFLAISFLLCSLGFC